MRKNKYLYLLFIFLIILPGFICAQETIKSESDSLPFIYAKKAIKQKAEDVARQIEIYLNAFPDKTLEDLQNDPEFQKIAIQPVGKTGYTVVADYNELVILFHPNKGLVGVKFESLSKKYPALWESTQKVWGGHDFGSIYKYPDFNGVLKDKYSYRKIIKKKTADGIGLYVGATTYLDEYETIELQEDTKERFPIIPMAWALAILILTILILFILNKLNIIKLEKSIIILLLTVALLLISGMFVFNAYNITKNLKKTAIENYFDTLNATASTMQLNFEQHIAHLKNSFKILSSINAFSNEDLTKIVELSDDFLEIFIIDANGNITHSSDSSHIGLSRLNDPYFKNVGKDLYIKPLYFSKTAGEAIFTISGPYNNGVLVSTMSLDQIHEMVSKRVGLGKSGESLLAYRNKNGDAVFFTDRRFEAEATSRDIIPKEDVNIPITQALLGNEKEFSDYVDYRGGPVFAVTKYISEIDAGLVVKIDQEEAFKSVSDNIYQIWYSAAIIIFSIIIIGVIFYFLLTYSLSREIKNKTQQLESASGRLRERVKELNSLYMISNLAEQPGMSLKQIFQSIIDFIPAAWQHPEITCAQLTIDGKEYKTANFKVTEWKQSAEIYVAGKKTGALDIFYLEKKSENNDAPFLKEERNLINEIADRLGRLFERRQAAEAISRLGRLFETSLNEIFLFEQESLKFVQANPAALHNLGYTMEELKALTALDIKPEISAESFTEIITPLISGETEKVVFETVHQRKNQSLYNTEVHLQLLKHEDKGLFAAIIVDITDRKKAQKDKIHLEEQYRQAQKMESIGRLAGGVAHDFNNALSVIRGFTEFAIESTDPKEQLHDDLNEILKATMRATDITRQLLAFARKQIISPKTLDLNEVIESMLKMIRHLIGEDIDLAWLPGANLWSVKMDPSQIDQILVNLCVNCRDAIDDVGKITIETDTVILDAAYCAEHAGYTPGEFVLLTVSDNGCGIPKENLDHIFEPFFTTKDVDKGTGLGLSTVYGIVKQNNGFINIYSEPGSGTTIKIYLPKHEVQKVEIQKDDIIEIPTGSGETILLVEDDLAVLKLVKKTLKGFGYSVLTADSPGKAIKLAEGYPDKIHLLITDVIMPEMNGRELSERLQSQYSDLKCIFMSGYTANAIAHHGVLDKGMLFIQKPFSKTDLAKIVRKVLDEANNSE